jgi:hypothetical protein
MRPPANRPLPAARGSQKLNPLSPRTHRASASRVAPIVLALGAGVRDAGANAKSMRVR